MPRHRQHPQGRTAATTHPPLELLPDPVRKLIEERGRLDAELVTAHNEHAAVFQRFRDEADTAARLADSKATVEATRAGNPEVVTTAQDELAERRKGAKRKRDALTEALDAVDRDLMTARGRWEQTGQAAAAEAAARAKLARAGKAFTAALSAANVAVAVQEWARGEFYDDSLTFRTIDLVPGLGRVIGPRASTTEVYPVDPIDVIDTITNL